MEYFYAYFSPMLDIQWLPGAFPGRNKGYLLVDCTFKTRFKEHHISAALGSFNCVLKPNASSHGVNNMHLISQPNKALMLMLVFFFIGYEKRETRSERVRNGEVSSQKQFIILISNLNPNFGLFLKFFTS